MKYKKLIIGLTIFSILLMVSPNAVRSSNPAISIDYTTLENPSQVSDISVKAITFTGTVSQGRDSTQHSFTVPTTATKVEARLTFSSSYDFDLSVWNNLNYRTGGWTSSDKTIKTNIPNSAYSGYSVNPEWVTVTPPSTFGTYKTGCFSYSGSGTYTITVTITESAGDTTPPTVSITSPANGATVSGTITVAASASDNVGVTKVEFYVDGALKATDTTSPYTYSLSTTTLTDGTHTILAKAYDAAGNTANSQVTVTVANGAPSNQLTSGVTVYGSLSGTGATYTWYIDVGPNAEKMRSVLNCGSADFDLYGRLNAQPTTSTYAWRGYTTGGEDVTYNNPGEGRWYIMVRSYSGSGAYDLTVTITYAAPDTTPPTVTITAPAAGSTVYSSTVAVSWTGSDSGSGINYYEVRLDSGSWINKGTSTSHSYTSVANGAHTVQVRAWDKAGNSAIASRSFNVDVSSNPVVKYAVIVGISDYKAISDLSYCDEDATDWYNHLNSVKMNFDYLWVYGDNHPANYPKYTGIATEYNVKQALINMVNLADSNDVIAFMTSGHGSGNGLGSSYLCMWDSGSGENGENGNLYDTELANILKNSVAAKIFVFIDHCYSGGFGPDLLAMSNSAKVFCTTTCNEKGYGYDYSPQKNGAWTYFFLEYAWINHYGGLATTAMETVFAYALAAYPYTGNDTPQKYDGNTAQSFYLS